jgi:hypothetical protein
VLDRGRVSDASVVDLIRDRALDAELTALVWLLSEGGMPVHVASDDPVEAARTATSLEDVGVQAAVLAGSSLEDVLARTTGDPARLGVVLVAGERGAIGGGGIVAAHYVRPPLRDAGGHIRDQRPAVLATWDDRPGGFEHFAWGIVPELADRVGSRAGDFEIEHRRRTDWLAALARSDIAGQADVRVAVLGYRAAVVADDR